MVGRSTSSVSSGIAASGSAVGAAPHVSDREAGVINVFRGVP